MEKSPRSPRTIAESNGETSKKPMAFDGSVGLPSSMVAETGGTYKGWGTENTTRASESDASTEPMPAKFGGG